MFIFNKWSHITDAKATLEDIIKINERIPNINIVEWVIKIRINYEIISCILCYDYYSKNH